MALGAQPGGVVAMVLRRVAILVGVGTVVGWYRKALEMCGVQRPRVVEEECRATGGKVCRYRVKWE